MSFYSAIAAEAPLSGRMPSPLLWAILLGLVAALADVAGGFLIARRPWSRVVLTYFIALGAGFMLATAFLEMLPESYRLRGEPAMFFVMCGYFVVHFFEHTVAPHFHFGEETHAEEMRHAHASYAALLGLVIHTFFDGVAIASGLLISTWLGILIFLAVFLHKLPEGFTVASLMLAGGQGKRAAVGAAALLGGSTLAGVLLMYALRGEVVWALPFSAGVTIYVAASDLIPEVNREPGVRVPLLVFLGVAFMLLLQHFFHA